MEQEALVSTRTRAPERRAALLQAAYRLFTRQGYHGTSMRQIARQAGVAPATIYHYFADKRALFAAVYEHHHPYRAVAQWLVEAAQEADVHRCLQRLLQRLHAALDQQPEFLNLVFIEWVEFQGRHARARWEAFLPRWRTALAQCRASPALQAQAPALLWGLIGVFIMSYLPGRLALPHMLPPERLLRAMLQAAAPGDANP